ncbi:MAG: hypothetical protein M9904_00905 [Chitinophagaceae bacterium]|nr:hypothetical protein [Chitinophagaceae bacterium]
MKHISKITALMAFTLSLMLFTGCKKEYGPDKIPNFPVMDVAPVPKFTMDADADLVIQQPEDFKSRFTLGLYFPEDQKTIPQSADISIVMNNNYKDIRKFKTGITTFPSAAIDITGADLAALFNINIEDIVPGYKFELRTDFTLKDGTVIPGFVTLPSKKDPAKGSSPNTVSSDVNNWPDSKTNIVFNAVCPLALENFVDDVAIEDPFFYEGDYEATITQEGDDILKLSGLNENPASSFLIKINFKAFTATVEKQVVEPTIWGYTNLAVEGSGTVDACNNTITLDLKWSVDQGNFGNGEFIISL